MIRIGAWSRVAMVTLFSAVFLWGFGAGTATAAGHVFKDPYQGGKRLGNGGGEPGKRYMTIADAAYTKDCPRMCKVVLGTGEGEEFSECVRKKELCQGMTMLLTNPKAHKVLDGYLKGDEATLDVELSWPDAPNSYMSVTMKQQDGRWQVDGFAASGSMDINVEVGGTADLGVPPGAEEALPATKR